MKALVDRLRALPAGQRERILAGLSGEEAAALRWAYPGFWLRPDARAPGSIIGTGQRPPPGEWIYWILQGGRGAGKSFACMIAYAEDAHELGPDFVGVVLVETDKEGEKLIEDPKTGMRAILPPWMRPRFEVSKGLLEFPSGAIAHVVSAEKPSKGRAPNFNRWFIDDPPKFGPQAKGVFDALARAFRLEGHGLRAYVSTTPPGDPEPRCPELLDFLLMPQFDPEQRDFVYSIDPSDANLQNLDAGVVRVLSMYKGTVHDAAERGGVYDPHGGAKVFREVDFTRAPVRVGLVPERFDVVVISIDPADSSNTHACEVGIVAAGLVTSTGQSFLLEDASALLDSDHWPDVAWNVAERWKDRAARWRFRVEINRGTKDCTLLKNTEVIRRMRRGEVGFSIADIRTVTSRKGKDERAEPLPMLYRAGQVHHGPGLDEVETQLRRLDNSGRGKLDRADAAVYALLDLFGLLDKPGEVLGGEQVLPGAFGGPAMQSITVGAPQRPAVTPQQAAPMVHGVPGGRFTFGGGTWQR